MATEDQIEKYRRLNKEREAGKELTEKELEFMKEYRAALEDNVNYLAEQVALMEEHVRQADTLVEKQELSIALRKKELQLAQKREDLTAAEIVALDKQIQQLDELKNQAREFDTLFDGLTGVSAKWEKTALGKLFTPTGLQALSMSFARTFTMANMLGSALMKVQEATIGLTLGTDKALVEFNKATGATRLYGDQIIALEQDMYRYGVSIDDAAQTYGALVKQVTGFNQLSAQQQASMATTVSMLNELGVDASITAGNIQTMTRVMGISEEGAATFSREMFTLAKSIGMPPAEMAQAFEAASPQMAKFGQEGTEVFKKLAVNARAAAMEVQQILSIVEKFDTFEGAADSVGKLNAILGGPFLSSLEMVQATDPTERMKLLSDAANDAGKSFDEMGYYERIALTEAMGLKDVSELALVMAGDFDHMANATKMNQSEMADLARQQQDFNTLADEATQVARMFAMQLKPLVDIAKSLMQTVQDINHAIGGNLVPIVITTIAVVKSLTLATRAWAAATTLITSLKTAMSAATVIANAGTAASIPLTAAAGSTAAAASPGLGMFALAALAVGAAGLMIGLGIGAAAAGMSLFMTALTAIPPATLILYGPAFLSLAMGVSAMAMAFQLLAPMAPLIAVVAGGLMLLGWALSSIDFSNLQPVADLFASMADAMNAPMENLIKIQSTISEISDAIKSIDDLDKAIVVKQLIEAASGQVTATAGPRPSASTAAASNSGAPVILQVDLGGNRVLTKVVGHVVGGMINPFN